MIYVVQILNQQFVKIGFTADEDVSVRIAQLQTGNPFEIKELFTVEGTLKQEMALHASLRVAFGRVRIPMPPNEWYPGASPFFRDFLDNLRYGANAGLAYTEKYNPAVRQSSEKKGSNVQPNFRWPTKAKL